MPSPTTALDIIKTAMRHLGALATGETPTAEEATDGLQALNDVIETWNIESLAVVGSLPSTYVTGAGQSTYTIGTGGDWNGQRPTEIESAYCSVNGVDFPIGIWTLAEWMNQPVKTVQQQVVERLAYVNSYPLGQVILWPTPMIACNVTINFNQAITKFAAPTDAFNLAPGYARALSYATAVELQAQYGGQDVSAQARATKSIIKRANRTPQIASFDSALMGGGRVVPARGY